MKTGDKLKIKESVKDAYKNIISIFSLESFECIVEKVHGDHISLENIEYKLPVGLFEVMSSETSLKMSKQEIVDLNKSEQIEMLKSFGLSSSEIKKLRFERQRVNKILEMQ